MKHVIQSEAKDLSTAIAIFSRLVIDHEMKTFDGKKPRLQKVSEAFACSLVSVGLTALKMK